MVKKTDKAPGAPSAGKEREKCTGADSLMCSMLQQGAQQLLLKEVRGKKRVTLGRGNVCKSTMTGVQHTAFLRKVAQLGWGWRGKGWWKMSLGVGCGPW